MGDEMSLLAGLRIIELSAFVAVPLGGATLAAMGADVIRIDPIGGGVDRSRLPQFRGRSLYWAGLNQGKRSVEVDLRSPRGQELVGRILSSPADSGGIVITNLPSRGWSSYERLRTFRSDLIMIVLTGNPDGSQAVDYTVNARLGFPYITGPEDHAHPVNHALPAWDAQAGYLVALAVLAAERHRRITGEGQLVTLSLFDVGLTLTARLGLLAEAELLAEPRPRSGNYVYGTFGRDFITSDGRELMVVALTPRQWHSVLEATGLGAEFHDVEAARGSNFDDEVERWKARDVIADMLQGWIGAHSFTDVASIFESHHVVWAPFQTFKQLIRDDKFVSADGTLLARVDDEGVGQYLLPRSPLRFSAVADADVAPPPVSGQHTREVLRTVACLSEQQVAELFNAGIAGGPSR